MRILHVIDRLNPGGAERVCVDLANIFHDQSHTVGVLLLLDTAKLDADLDTGIQVYYLKRDSKWNLAKYKEAAKICREYDIIHIHMRHVYRYMMVVKLITGLKSRFIFHDHFGDINTNKSKSLFFNTWFSPSFYIGVSTELTKWAIQNLKIEKAKVFLLSNIVRKRKGTVTLSQLNDVVVVSNIRRTKNIEFAIAVAAKAKLNIDIIGQLVEKDYHDELLILIRELGMENHVRFILDCYDVQPLLSSYKLAIHTAKSETGPLVLMEYLAQGLKFLSYNTGEVAKELNSILPHFFLDSFELEAWTKNLNALLGEPSSNEKLMEIFEGRYGEQQYYEKCLRIYQVVLHS